jgi:hypothetical protein
MHGIAPYRILPNGQMGMMFVAETFFFVSAKRRGTRTMRAGEAE